MVMQLAGVMLDGKRYAIFLPSGSHPVGALRFFTMGALSGPLGDPRTTRAPGNLGGARSDRSIRVRIVRFERGNDLVCDGPAGTYHLERA